MFHGPDLTDFARASSREWRLADGLGGRASGTSSGAPTRRSHALLATPGPGTRTLARVLRFEERLSIGAAAHELSAAYHADGRIREGAFAQLESYACEPWPVWRWRFGATRIGRSFRLVPQHHALVASWRLLAGGPVKLGVSPLLVARGLGDRQFEATAHRGGAQGIPGRVRFEPLPGGTALTLWHNAAFLPARGWARGLAAPLEDPDEAFGLVLPAGEDAYVPGSVQATLDAPGAALHVVISTEDALFRALAAEERLGTPPARTLNDCIAALDARGRERQAAWLGPAIAAADFTARQAAASHGGAAGDHARRSEPLVGHDEPVALALAARLERSLVRRAGRLSFLPPGAAESDCVSDTLRAATALVSLRAFEPAREIAAGVLGHIDEGLAPERHDPDDGRAIHGGPEPSLWLVNLVELLARRSGMGRELEAFIGDQAWPALEGVLHHLRAGARGNVHCERDGLLWQGAGAQARADASTNALWYHALVAMAQLGKLLGRRENSAFYLAWAHELQRAYVGAFWDERAGALFEALTPAGRVRGLSPRQLWAVSLSPALLAPPYAQPLLASVERELFTPAGLRERPGDGPPQARWLGAWAAASGRVHGRDGAAGARITATLAAAALDERIRVADRGSPGAVGDPLAIAELLRAWLEDAPRVVSEGAPQRA